VRGGSIFWNRVIVIQRQSRHTKVNNSSVGKDCSLGFDGTLCYPDTSNKNKCKLEKVYELMSKLNKRGLCIKIIYLNL